MIKLGFDSNKNLKQKFKITCTMTATFYLICMTSTILVNDKLFSTAENQFYFIISFVVSNTYTTLFLIGFCLIIYAVYWRYIIINECMKHYFKTEEEDSEKDFTKEILSPEAIITKLAILHDTLNDAVNDINECCSFEVTLVLWCC